MGKLYRMMFKLCGQMSENLMVLKYEIKALNYRTELLTY